MQKNTQTNERITIKISLKMAWVLIFISMAAVFLVFIFTRNKREVNNEIATSKKYDEISEIVFNVRTAKVIVGDFISLVKGSGTANAFSDLDIIVNANGYVNVVNVFEGKKVFKDDLLISLDDKEPQIGLREAEAKLEEARIQLVVQKVEMGMLSSNKLEGEVLSNKNNSENRVNQSKTTDVSIKQQKEATRLELTAVEKERLFETKSGLTTAVSNLERAKLNLSYTKIFAPFSGVIADFHLIKGSRVSTGEKLFKLMDISRLKIEVGVLEMDAPKIQIGRKVDIVFNAIPNETFTGLVRFINPAVDPEKKNCRITIEMQNGNSNLKPGMFASVSIVTQTDKDRILIPKEAILIRDRKTLVFVRNGKLAKWRYVQVGRQNEQYMEILDGLKPGEEVIVDGHFNLANDAKIRVTES